MRVLIADDDRVSRTVLQLRLSQLGYEVVSAGDGQAAWEILQAEDAPQLAILDWMMPGMDGVSVVKEVRRRAAERYTYLLMLTSRQDTHFLVEAMEAGADDYLTKPVEISELEVRLRAGTRILQLQEDLLASQEALRVQATHDGLTGLWNRAAVLEAFRRELARADREQRPVGVIMADIDHFKEINDTLGHPVGDQVIREVAERIEGSIRCYDVAGRYGGEEFLVVLPGCPPGEVVAVARRICEAVRRKPVIVGPVAVPVTLSLGVTAAELDGSETMEDLVARADRALYLAKDAGRDRASFIGMPERTTKLVLAVERVDSEVFG
jgi:two-component system, cell cycle response regulator